MTLTHTKHLGEAFADYLEVVDRLTDEERHWSRLEDVVGSETIAAFDMAEERMPGGLWPAEDRERIYSVTVNAAIAAARAVILAAAESVLDA